MSCHAPLPTSSSWTKRVCGRISTRLWRWGGAPALSSAGFFAEGWNMTLAEWQRYHEVVAGATAGRLPLFTIILDHSAYQAIEKNAVRGVPGLHRR